MKKTIAAFALLLIFAASCKKEAIVKSVPSQERQQIALSRLKTADLVAAIEKAKAHLISGLKNADTNKANQLYEIFRGKTDTLVYRINAIEVNLTENYYSMYYDQKAEKVVIPDSLQPKIKLFENAGLELVDVGEGFVEINLIPSYFYNLFKNHVSEDYKEYLKLEAEDNAELFQADAGIIVSLEEVTHRTLKWEQFLTRYPKSRQFENARETYANYLHAFLVGYDNTPVITDDGKGIYAENQKEFDKVMTKYPETVTAKMIAFLYKVLPESPDNNLNEIIYKEQQQYLTSNN